MGRMSGVAAWCEDEVERRDDVGAAAAAGWPFGGGLAMAEEERSFDMLAQEVEDLIERQPQFAFLKPCRQLEKHYANKRAERSKGVKDLAVARSDRSSSSCSSSSSSIRELISCDGIELNGFVEEKAETPRAVMRRRGGGHFHRNSGEKIWRISSTRCSIHEREAHIDLVNPAATQFLMAMSPSAAHTPAAVPFKWEDAPGRAKARAEATTNPILQLPPRLAAPLQRNTTTTLSRQLVMSHPLAGLFPCIGATSPSPSPPPQQQQQQQDEIKWEQYRASKSYGGVHRKAQSKSQPLAATETPGLKPRRLFSSELAHSDPSTSSRSISHQSSSSRTTTYLSCELDASTPGSKSSSSASYESIGEDFDESPHHRRSQPGLLKLCKSHGNCLRKSKSRRRRMCSNPEVWAPTLATYFQHLDVNDEPLLEKQGAAPTSSGYLNSKGEPQPLQQPRNSSAGSSSPETVSPKRPTRLPYKMPSVAEQEQSRSKSRRSTGHRSALSMDLQCPSPAYAAALEMLSPAAVTLMTSRRHRGGALPTPRPHRRVQFILSMCKTLKRVLFRQQARRSVIGTRLMYHDERAPTTFQFSKPN